MNGIGFFLLVLLGNTSPAGGLVPPAPREPVVAAAATGGDTERDRELRTGSPGRTGSEATGAGTGSRDPTKGRGRQPSREHGSVGPEPAGNPAGQGPGDSIGKTVPERPTHQDRKLP